MSGENDEQIARLPFKDVPIDLHQKIVSFGVKPDLNVLRVLANNPAHLSAFIDFANSIQKNCMVPRHIRELMILRGAQLCNCRYQWLQHERIAKQCGVPMEKINLVREWQTSSLYDENEKVAIELMESLIHNGGEINEELDEKVKRHFTESEYIELVLTGSFYIMVSTLLKALQIPEEK